MKQILLSRQDLAARWNLNARTIIEYELNGVIKRVPKLQVPRYAISQIEEIENAGLDINPLSPIERKRLERRILELEEKVNHYEEKINSAKMALV